MIGHQPDTHLPPVRVPEARGQKPGARSKGQHIHTEIKLMDVREINVVVPPEMRRRKFVQVIKMIVFCYSSVCHSKVSRFVIFLFDTYREDVVKF